MKLAYEQVIVVFKVHFPHTEFCKEVTGRKYFLLLTVVIQRTHTHTHNPGVQHEDHHARPKQLFNHHKLVKKKLFSHEIK